MAAKSPDAAAGYDTEQRGTRRLTRVAGPPLCVFAFLAASLGVLAVPAVAGPLDRALGAAGEPSPAWWQLAVTAMAALLASAVTWWWGARPVPVPALARGWLHLERAARVLVADPAVWLARALAAFDDDGVHRVVAGVAAAARSAGRLAPRGCGWAPSPPSPRRLAGSIPHTLFKSATVVRNRRPLQANVPASPARLAYW